MSSDTGPCEKCGIPKLYSGHVCATLGERVLEARTNLGLSQEEAADFIGVPLADLQQLEAPAMLDQMIKEVDQGWDTVESLRKERDEALEAVRVLSEAGFLHGSICFVCSHPYPKHDEHVCWYGKSLAHPAVIAARKAAE